MQKTLLSITNYPIYTINLLIYLEIFFLTNTWLVEMANAPFLQLVVSDSNLRHEVTDTGRVMPLIES